MNRSTDPYRKKYKLSLEKRQYFAIHKWVGKHFTKTGVCESCKEEKRTEWSNKDGKYFRGREDWQELCKKCHHAYDTAVLGKPTYADMARMAHKSPKWKKSAKRGGFASMSPERRTEVSLKGLNSRWASEKNKERG